MDQKALLKCANKVTATVFKLMEGLAADGVPHCFEQPASSLMLKGQAFRSWASRWGAQRAVVDMCQFGRPLQKADGDLGRPERSAGRAFEHMCLPRAACGDVESLGRQRPQRGHRGGLLGLFR